MCQNFSSSHALKRKIAIKICHKITRCKHTAMSFINMKNIALRALICKCYKILRVIQFLPFIYIIMHTLRPSTHQLHYSFTRCVRKHIIMQLSSENCHRVVRCWRLMNENSLRGDDNDVKICRQLRKRFRYGLIKSLKI